MTCAEYSEYLLLLSTFWIKMFNVIHFYIPWNVFWSLWRRNGQKLKNTTSRDEHQWFIMWQCSSDIIITPSYSTWIFCRGVSGFATDCPCDVWCRGLTTSLLNFVPPFENRFSNTSWAVGLTYWIVYLHLSVFWHMQSYMSWYVISFFGFIFTS